MCGGERFDFGAKSMQKYGGNSAGGQYLELLLSAVNAAKYIKCPGIGPGYFLCIEPPAVPGDIYLWRKNLIISHNLARFFIVGLDGAVFQTHPPGAARKGGRF